uniref:Uncharacterized protein n=1 Tax=Setaria viridis TaxID=4556 RepID=A0A4U6U6B5_SETVI|nr:hypothetical protein SEVIR_6G212566v2 [Setaria viridis]
MEPWLLFLQAILLKVCICFRCKDHSTSSMD